MLLTERPMIISLHSQAPIFLYGADQLSVALPTKTKKGLLDDGEIFSLVGCKRCCRSHPSSLSCQARSLSQCKRRTASCPHQVCDCVGLCYRAESTAALKATQ